MYMLFGEIQGGGIGEINVPGPPGDLSGMPRGPLGPRRSPSDAIIMYTSRVEVIPRGDLAMEQVFVMCTFETVHVCLGGRRHSM